MPRSYHTFSPLLAINSEEPEDVLEGQDCLRRRVLYHFMDPLQKFQIKKKIPFKIILSFVLIILITIQLFSYESHNYNYTQEHRDTERTLKNIFLKDWDNGAKPEDYTVYTIPDFYDNLDFVVQKFGQFGITNLGTFGYDSPDGTLTPIQFCKTYFKDGHIYPNNNTVVIESKPIEECVEIPPVFPAGDPSWNNFSTKEFLETNNKPLDFSQLVSARVSFPLKLINLLGDLYRPSCYRLQVEVNYRAFRHDGQIPIRLTTSAEKQKCLQKEPVTPVSSGYELRQFQNFSVLIVASVLSILVLRSIYRGQKLKYELKRVFKTGYDSTLSLKDQYRFLDAWFIIILVSNTFLIAGSVIKLQIEFGTSSDLLYSVCSVFLGTGNLLAWLGLLRYLDFFTECNIIIVTMRRAAGFVLRGMVAAFVIFMGYAVCGWLVLGPYHSKFRFLSTASETLYCLMYGDDMFPTYSDLETSSSLIWYFSRVYLYSFIFIFICAVLSIVSAIIMDVYDTLKSRTVVQVPSHFMALDDFLEIDGTEDIDQLREIYRRSDANCFCRNCQRFSLLDSLRRLGRRES